jgi:hypothetical protein
MQSAALSAIEQPGFTKKAATEKTNRQNNFRPAFMR